MPKNSKKTQKPRFISGMWQRLKSRRAAFLNRRPHRSFQRTRRRDYVRPLRLPGYFTFTFSVNKMLWGYKKIFLPLIAIYIIIYLILVGMQSQDAYTAITGALKDTSGDLFNGDWGALGQAGLLFFSVASAGAGQTVGEGQQIFSVLIVLLAWLTSVWLLRNLLAGHKVKLRDGLYNSGAPILSTAIIAVLIAIQLLPIAIAAIGYSAAQASGLLAGGVEAMLFWAAAVLLALLSLYWVTSSLFAMIIITLPGVYPYSAIKNAGDLVLGRRTKILLRWLWMVGCVAITWALILIPIILLDMWLKSAWPAIQWLPVVPFSVVLLSAATTIWVSSYVYLLYRKVIDNAD